MKKLVLLVFFFISKNLLWGQNTTCPDNFKAYNQQGQEVTQFCVGQPVRFRSCLPNTQPDKEYYDFDKTNNLTFNDTVKVTTFTRPGTYTVTQLLNTGQISQKERTFVVVDTPPPTFNVVSCAQNQVKVSLTDNVYNSYHVDFNDGTRQNITRNTPVLHTYGTNGPFKVTVTGSFTGTSCSGQSEKDISPLPPPVAPALENIRITKMASTGSLVLGLKNLQPEYLYVLERMNGTTATLIDTIKNPANATQEFTLNNINTTNSVCFRVRLTDRCGSNITLPAAICSQPFTATNGNIQININWPAYPENAQLENYQLYRNGNLLQTLPGSTLSFTDTDVACGTRYCYQLRAGLKNNYTAVSADTCLMATTNIAPPPGTLQSTFSPTNQVLLTFAPVGNSPVKSISYQKSTNNAAFANLATTDQTTYTDAPVGLVNNQVCYQASFNDNCGNTSPASNITCPVFLQAALTPDGLVNLSWTEYIGFSTNGQYFVERLEPDGNVASSTPVTGNTFTTPALNTQQQLIYRIKVTSGNAQEISYSNTQLLRQESSFRIPTAFSPNGDNLNDRFEIKGIVFGKFSLSVYDRWGKVVFRSNNQAQGWDGNINGREAPVGVYAYSLNATDTTGKQIIKTGTITLVR